MENKCKECKGRGKVTRQKRDEAGNWVYVERDCACSVPPTQQGAIE